MNSRLVLQLSVPPDWDQIEPVRQAVALCVEAVFGRVAFRESLAMVSSELLENAIKHGAPTSPVRLEVGETTDGAVDIVVTNQLADRADGERLNDRIGWVRSFRNPVDAYTQAMQRAVAELRTGGLGLPRIAHEGRCVLSCDVSTPGEVSVTARFSPVRSTEKGGASSALS